MNEIDGLEYESATVTMNLDTDWVKLILEARDIGLTIEEIRLFLNNTNSSSVSHTLLAGAAE